MTAPRILIVEDERILALNLRHRLTRLGYDVPNAVSTGDHALRRIEEAVPDLVLMDINLKGKLDGIATATAIRQLSVIPIIYLTAHSADETLARAAATNPHGYLLKPFSERELHAMIQVTLARCRTERESLAARERLQQATKMEALSLLAGGVADEVDDLLTSLYGHLEMLGGYGIGEPALNDPIQDAFGDAIEKERLVRQLMEFCGRRKLTPATVSINELLARLGGRLHQILGDTIAIRMLLPDNLRQARVDPDRLAQALAYLATNARAAMPEQGSLTIEVQNIIAAQNPRDDGTRNGDYVLVSVTDTGSGMAEGVVERAFEPFFSTRPSGTASGLGLSLVFSFVRQSGGDITIESKPGKGTTVRLYLPATTSDAIVIAARGETEPGCGAGLEQGGHPATETVREIVFSHTAAKARQPNDDDVRRVPIAPRKQNAASPVMWHRAENAVFASMSGSGIRGTYHLVVEPMPKDPGWDWTVWRRGGKGKHARHGRASSVLSAMAAAENAAEVWSRGGRATDQSDPLDENP